MNDWGIFYCLFLVSAPYIICYFIGKGETKTNA